MLRDWLETRIGTHRHSGSDFYKGKREAYEQVLAQLLRESDRQVELSITGLASDTTLRFAVDRLLLDLPSPGPTSTEGKVTATLKLDWEP